MTIEDYKKDECFNDSIKNPYIYISIGRKKNFNITGIGVYMFVNKDNYPIYIGFSRQLNERISMHFRDSGLMQFMPDATGIKIFFNKDTKHEQKLIKLYNPKYNNAGYVSKCNKSKYEEEADYDDYIMNQ